MYRKILEALPDIIYLKDLSGNIIYTNITDRTLTLKKLNNGIYIDNMKRAYSRKEMTIDLDGQPYKVIHYKENTELYQIIINQSKDSVTGIANRLMVDKYLKERQNTGKNFTIAMIDIDHFKQFNDKFGHLYGDKVLAEVAYILKNEISDIDFVGRYGGEEFIMVLNSLTFGESLDKLNEIRQKIENYFHNPNDKITISIGVSKFVEGDLIIDKIEEADKALYNVKRKGRNNVSFWDSLKQEFILME